MNVTGKCFLHVDMDAFFASVEQHDHPEWKGKPVIVGGLPDERRSVVSTASYEARKFGVHSAMPSAAAYRLCPQGIFTHCRMARYSEISAQIMEILSQFSPDVQQLSIDEACIDITGTEKLFGPPEEIARQIKAQIAEKTGLTVSCGIAQTRYLSKIASEIKKPDGLFIVPTGTEEDFMMTLPLKKVWGIGKKTLERLHKAGFYTTKQIFEKQKELLCIAFGTGTGTFLYNAVRGLETESFSAPTHSVSNETTFPFDLTDRYTAETALMELCCNVYFRLLREKSYSRTVMVKIKYEDFSTVTVQETSDEYITSADDLYRRTCALFEKKADMTKGIRLLGVGAENVETEKAGGQQTLFDFGEKKKQAVENAILSLNEKHPEIKIKKARTLDAPKKQKITLFLLFLLSFFPNKTATAETPPSTANISPGGAGTIALPSTLLTLPVEESPASLFDYTINDSRIEFLAKGWWQAELSNTANFSFGSSAGSSSSVPVLKQEVDLSLWFMLNRQWYFKTSFADEFTKNTVAAGFYGKDNNPLREFKIANRGIIVPSGYSIDSFNLGIGGGENQAPGLQAHFQDTKNEMPKWKGDVAFRYDITEQKDAVFYGKNSVRTKKITLSNYVEGQFFVLPTQELTQAVSEIYVESKNGTYKDFSGRTYKKIPSDQYLIKSVQNLIIISKDAAAYRTGGKLPSVAVSFSGGEDFVSACGTYSDETTFLGAVQSYFSSVSEVDLERYASPLSETIDGKKVLVLQSSAGFSPFTCANIYDCGLSSDADVIVASQYTEEQSSLYSAQTVDAETTFVSDDFFYEKHTFASITRAETTGTDSFTKPQIRFPAADKNPQIYLSPDSAQTDLVLLVKKYTPVSRYDIGTNVSAGSVKVYRNGLLDYGATYNQESGEVTLSTSVSDYDKIYITWNEDSAGTESGSVAAQISWLYNFNSRAAADISVSTVWPLSPYVTYAEYEKPVSGYAAVSGGVSWNTEQLKLSNALAASVNSVNTTGIYRMCAFDDAEPKTVYLGQNAGSFLPSGTAPSLNSRDFSSSKQLSPQENCTIESSSKDGLKDSGITGYKIPLEFTFSGIHSETPWSAINVNLSDGSSLTSATEFRIALKAENSSFTEYDVYLQLGIDTGDDPDIEYSTRIPTWNISDSGAENVSVPFQKDGSFANADGWQTVTVILTDSDRARLSAYSGLRLIAAGKNSGSDGTGSISIGPYEIIRQGIFAKTEGDFEITTSQEKDNSIKKSYDRNDDNYVQKVSWSYTGNGGESSRITAAKYLNEADISSYKKIQFSFRFDTEDYASSAQENTMHADGNGGFTFILDRNAESIEENGKIAVKAVLSQTAFEPYLKNRGNSFHTMEIDIQNKKILIDGNTISGSDSSVFINKNVVPSRMKIEFLPAVSKSDGEEENALSVIQKGTFTIDELILDGTSPYFLLQDTAKIEAEKKGTVISIGKVPLIQDASFSSRTDAGISLQTDGNTPGDRLLTNSTQAEVSVAGIQIHTEASLSSAEKNALSSAGHSVKTGAPLFGIFSADDGFLYYPADQSTEKTSSAALNLKRLHIPLAFSAANSFSDDRWAYRQSGTAKSALEFGGKSWSFSLTADADVSQKRTASSSGENSDEKNYFEEYCRAGRESFSAGKSDATSRNIKFSAKMLTKISPAALSPSINFQTEGKYACTTDTVFSDTTEAGAEIPFRIRKNSFSFKYKKEGGGKALCAQGGDYKNDAENLIEKLGERTYYFSAVPFYDLFSAALADEMRKTTANSAGNQLSYSGTYSFLWKRGLSAGIKDLLIPSSVDFSAARDIIITDTESDIYQLKATVLNTPFNLFGSQSRLRLFKWYKTDEFAFSLTGAVKIPASSPKDTLFSISTYAQGGFYMNDSDVLKLAAQFKLETDTSWNTQYTALWKRRCKSSPVMYFIKLFCPQKAAGKISAIKLTRTDSLDFSLSFSDSTEKLTQKYEISHRLDATILSYLSIYLGASASYTDVQDNTALLGITATIGGKLEF